MTAMRFSKMFPPACSRFKQLLLGSCISGVVMKIGINYWFGYPSLAKERTALLKNSGFTEVSLLWTNEYIHITGEKHTIPPLLDKNGITISSFHLSFDHSGLLWAASSEGALYRHEILTAIQDAKDLSVDTIVMHTDGVISKQNDIRAVLYPLLEKAEQYGIHLCMENLQHEDNLAQILDADFGLEVSLCYDTGHNHIRKCPFPTDDNPFIKYLHIHDNWGMDDTHSLPFTGSVNWNKQLIKLERYRDIPKILEVHENIHNWNDAEAYLQRAYDIAITIEKKWVNDQSR